jgi:hypothetical protein
MSSKSDVRLALVTVHTAARGLSESLAADAERINSCSYPARVVGCAQAYANTLMWAVEDLNKALEEMEASDGTHIKVA